MPCQVETVSGPAIKSYLDMENQVHNKLSALTVQKKGLSNDFLSIRFFYFVAFILCMKSINNKKSIKISTVTPTNM